MALNGRLLGQARERLLEIKNENGRELARRQAEVYARLPALPRLEDALRRLMSEVVAVTLRRGGDVAAAISGIEKRSLDLQAERAELLVSAGYPAQYIDEIYSCKRCRDTGYQSGKPCACLLALYEKERAADMTSLLKLGPARFESFDLSYYDDSPVAGVSARDGMRVVLEVCREYPAAFGPQSMNLLFRGGTGLGKTFLSACVGRAVAARGFSVVYDTAGAAFQAFETQKFSREPEAEAQAAMQVRRMLESDLMILDDLGTEMITSFSQSALYTLLNTRLVENRKTIISTNLRDEELHRAYTPQICSRLEGEYQTLSFRGRDIRAIKKERGLA